MKRMWINQPSTLQPLHRLHGVNVLAVKEPHSDNLMRVYFLKGTTISRPVPRLSLSEGWVAGLDEEKNRESN